MRSQLSFNLSYISFCCTIFTGCPNYFRPLTVLISNFIYRCDIIHPLVRYHGRSRRSPAPPPGPLGGPSGPLVGPSGPLGGPSGPLGRLSGPLGGSSVRAVRRAGRPSGRAAVRTLKPRASLLPSVVRDCYHPIYMVLWLPDLMVVRPYFRPYFKNIPSPNPVPEGHKETLQITFIPQVLA